MAALRCLWMVSSQGQPPESASSAVRRIALRVYTQKFEGESYAAS